MKNATIAVSFDEEKLAAAKLYLAQKDMRAEEELGKAMEALYLKYVPGNVREFIEMKNKLERPKKMRTAKESVQEESSGVDCSEAVES